MLRAKKEKTAVIDAATLKAAAPRQALSEITYPKKLRSGTILKGDPGEKASQLVSILNQKSII